MNKLNDFQIQIKAKIKKASHSKRIKFGLDICKRLLPDYKAFNEKFKWGNTEILLDSIDFMEKQINNQNYDLLTVEQLINKIDLVIPDTEDFASIEVSYALNSSVSVQELLMYLKDKNMDHVFVVSTLMTDTIDFKIQEMLGTLNDDIINSHPMMLKEFKHQLDQL